jgi:hypothetical protein
MAAMKGFTVCTIFAPSRKWPVAHLEEDIAAARIRLTAAELAALG